jgi:hypothetical protein
MPSILRVTETDSCQEQQQVEVLGSVASLFDPLPFLLLVLLKATPIAAGTFGSNADSYTFELQESYSFLYENFGRRQKRSLGVY